MVLLGEMLMLWQESRASVVVWMLLGGKAVAGGQCRFCFIPRKPKAGVESSTHFFSPGFPLFLLLFALPPSQAETRRSFLRVSFLFPMGFRPFIVPCRPYNLFVR